MPLQREFRVLHGVRAVAFSPNGDVVLSGGGGVQLWDVATGKELHQLRGEIVFSLAFSPDGKLALFGCDHIVRVWDVEKWQELRRFEGHKSSFGIYSVAFSPDGRRALSGSDGDCSVRLWEVDTGKQIHVLEGHGAGVTSVAFSPDEKLALTASGGGVGLDKDDVGRIILWNLETGKEIKTHPPRDLHAKPNETTLGITYAAVAFSPDGKQALFGGSELVLWDIERWQAVQYFGRNMEDIHSVAFSPDGKRALTGGKSDRSRSNKQKSVILWDVASGNILCQVEGHLNEADINSVAFSPDGKFALSGGRGRVGWGWGGHGPAEDDVVRLWRLPK